MTYLRNKRAAEVEKSPFRLAAQGIRGKEWLVGGARAAREQHEQQGCMMDFDDFDDDATDSEQQRAKRREDFYRGFSIVSHELQLMLPARFVKGTPDFEISARKNNGREALDNEVIEHSEFFDAKKYMARVALARKELEQSPEVPKRDEGKKTEAASRQSDVPRLDLDAILENKERARAMVQQAEAKAKAVQNAIPMYDLAALEKLIADMPAAYKDIKLRDNELSERLRKKGPFRNFVLHQAAAANLFELRDEMPHLGEVIDDLRGAVVLAQKAQRPIRIEPILLLGGPGIGKSHFAMRLAKALGVTTARTDMANAQTGAGLAGSARYWSNTACGSVFNQLALGDHASPVMLLDEIEKAGHPEQHSDPLDVLLPLLEPETARAFEDASYPLPLDARHIIWIATANSIEGLSAPLLSRFRVYQIEAPRGVEAIRLAARIARSVLTELGFERMDVADAAIEKLAGFGPRGVRQAITRACARVVLDERERIELADIEAPPAALAAFGQHGGRIGFLSNLGG